MGKQMHLNLFVHSRGHHEASWRHPKSSPKALTDISYLTDAARTAELGLFDSIFLADTLVVNDDVAQAPRLWLEPISTLGALAMVTKKIGLIATASTTYMEPFNLARQFASLDHVSAGRIGWNIVTTWSVPAASNFGANNQISHADRYLRAEEYVKIIKELWDSWSDDAVVDNRTGGLYAKGEGIRPIDHTGDYYQVAGPLNVPRCPQGRPVLVQAGSSEVGREFAARHAEAVFTAHLEMATALDFYKDLKSRAKAQRRDPDSIIILPGFSPIIAGTEAEAKQIAKELNELTDVEVGRKRLTGRFGGYDFSHLPLDRPLTQNDFPDPSTVQAARSRAEVIVGMVTREKPTLRQLLAKLAGARGHFIFAGTPEQVANELELWFKSGAADGFNLMPPIIPWMLEVFVEEVVPVLQQRGLFRKEYKGSMLRDHFGLERPSVKLS
ncbi:MAG: LLM class flavin-dependent oxidoreductase [Pseudomonadota bacterium]|nr:LLM class flavin-dependent oxidoreductase [Pseudomonadota bacterium]